MKSIQKESWSYNYDPVPEPKKIPIACQLCTYNFQNEYCQINDREDEFLPEDTCDGFEFCPFHLIEYLKALEAKE